MIMGIDRLLADRAIEPVGAEFTPPTKEEIRCIEEILGAPLPEKYRYFLERYGCSRFPDLATIASLDGRQGFSFDCFYGGGGGGTNLLAILEAYRGRMPASVLPIGGDWLGNQFCLGVTAPDLSKLFFWDHEDEQDPEDYLAEGIPMPEGIWYLNMTLVASSLADFLGRLTVGG
jgi:hypothetical protein